MIKKIPHLETFLANYEIARLYTVKMWRKLKNYMDINNNKQVSIFMSIASWGTAAFLRISESCPLRPCWGKSYSRLPSPNCCAAHSVLLWLSSPSLPLWLSSIFSFSPWQSHTVTLQLLRQQLSGFFLWSNCTAKGISQGWSLPE